MGDETGEEEQGSPEWQGWSGVGTALLAGVLGLATVASSVVVVPRGVFQTLYVAHLGDHVQTMIAFELVEFTPRGPLIQVLYIGLLVVPWLLALFGLVATLRGSVDAFRAGRYFSYFSAVVVGASLVLLYFWVGGWEPDGWGEYLAVAAVLMIGASGESFYYAARSTV